MLKILKTGKKKGLKITFLAFLILFVIIFILGLIKMKFFSQTQSQWLKQILTKENRLSEVLQKIFETQKEKSSGFLQLKTIATSSFENFDKTFLGSEIKKIAKQESEKMFSFAEKYQKLVRENKNKSYEDYTKELIKIKENIVNIQNLKDLEIYTEKILNELVNIQPPSKLKDFHKILVLYYASLYYIIRENNVPQIDPVRAMVLSKITQMLLDFKFQP